MRAARTALALLVVTAGCSKAADVADPKASVTVSAPGTATLFAAAPAPRDPEKLLRTELATWKGTPYLEDGTSHTGVGNATFVREVYQGAFGVAIPASYDEQFHTGKLVEREKLQAGDLVFFEGSGFGPFKSRWVGIYAGHGDVAIARKDLGVAIVHLADAPWTTGFRTARRLPNDPNAPPPPALDRAKYGSNKAALLRDIALSWSGTLYRQGGTTFDGIGNAEFVRSVYEAVNEAELEGTPQDWGTLGEDVPKSKLQPGDVILYGGSSFSQRSAGIYIGDGDFVHAVKGSAVTISQIDDPKWSSSYKDARRIDPDALTKMEEARATGATKATSTKPAPATTAKNTGAAAHPSSAKTKSTTSSASSNAAPAAAKPAPTAAPAGPPRPMPETEKQLRAVTEEWRGTPYKIGGTTKAGIDCSAFVRTLFEEVFKVELPRTAEEQESLGTKVSRDKLQTGDLVFFRTQGMGPLFKSRHVGLYLGNGEFAQSSGKNGVTISRLDNYYWNQKYESARRMPATAVTTESQKP